MSKPVVTCDTCQRRMALSVGFKAMAIRPERAKTLLRRSCKFLDSRCRFSYSAGVGPLSVVTGQDSSS